MFNYQFKQQTKSSIMATERTITIVKITYFVIEVTMLNACSSESIKYINICSYSFSANSANDG